MSPLIGIGPFSFWNFLFFTDWMDGKKKRGKGREGEPKKQSHDNELIFCFCFFFFFVEDTQISFDKAFFFFT